MNSKEREVMEPVAWMDIDEKGFGYGLRYWSEPDNRHEVPLYTTPPQRTAAQSQSDVEGEDTRRAWEGLSVFEINDLVTNTEHGLHELVERTEKLLKEKNT